MDWETETGWVKVMVRGSVMARETETAKEKDLVMVRATDSAMETVKVKGSVTGLAKDWETVMAMD